MFRLPTGLLLIALLSLTACNRTDSDTDTTPESAAPPAAVSAASNLQLARGQAGEVRLTMPLADAQRLYGAQLRQVTVADPHDDHTVGATATPYELVDSTGSPLLRVVPVCQPVCQVSRIVVLSPTYTTPAGIGVGSQLSEVRAAHPVQDLQWRPTEGLSLRLPDFNARLIFDVTDLDQAALDNPALDKLPATLLVEQIILE